MRYVGISSCKSDLVMLELVKLIMVSTVRKQSVKKERILVGLLFVVVHALCDTWHPSSREPLVC